MKLNNGTMRVKNITKLTEFNLNNCVCEVTFEGEDSTAIYYTDTISYFDFIGQEVDVLFRDEIYNGKICQHVIQIAKQKIITTLDKESNIKLYSNEILENGCTVTFRDIPEYTAITDAIVYCKEHIYDASVNSTWAKLIILDKERRVSTLRIFNYEQRRSDFSGQYIKFSGKYTQWGFQSEEVFIANNLHMPVNPAQSLALNFLNEIIKSDTKLSEFVESKDYLSALSRYRFEDEEETGSVLVKLAMEVAIAQDMINLTPHVNKELLVRGLFATYGYATVNVRDHVYSKKLLNISVIGATNITSKQLTCILEGNDSPVELLEAKLVYQIKEIVKTCYHANTDVKTVLSSNKIWG